MKTETNMIELVNEYLTFRRRLGYKMMVEGKELLLFARYAVKMGHCGPPTIAIMTQWSKSARTPSLYYQAKRYELVRRFAKYCSLFDPHTEIPPQLGVPKCRRQPYIYSAAEVAVLLQAAARLSPTEGLRCRTYATLIGLLVTTGLRISEAINVRDEDVDLPGGILTVKNTKFRKSRLVPLHPSTVLALQRYRDYRDVTRHVSPAKRFFVTEHGRFLNYGAVLHIFKKLRRALHRQGIAGKRLPRIHDFRHTFAVRNLLRWSAGKDNPERKIFTLSVYLGHAQVTDTYWYLSAVPELFAVVSNKFDHFAHHNHRRNAR